jgi:hypothetical protein
VLTVELQSESIDVTVSTLQLEVKDEPLHETVSTLQLEVKDEPLHTVPTLQLGLYGDSLNPSILQKELYVELLYVSHDISSSTESIEFAIFFS